MKVFLNPGHSMYGFPDSGANGNGLRECDVVAVIAAKTARYLEDVGVETKVFQGPLEEVSSTSNAWGPDVFVSIHCGNSESPAMSGTETYCYCGSAKGHQLASTIQEQIIGQLATANRGVKESDHHVLRSTDCPAVQVNIAYITNIEDADLLKNAQDDFAQAIARGITDYDVLRHSETYHSKYFSEYEMMCHGGSQGHCSCGIETATRVSERLLELLDTLRENVGGPIEVSCMYRCPEHNAAVGGVSNSQHVDGTAADLQWPSFVSHGEFEWYVRQLPFDGVGIYSWGIHVDVRDGGTGIKYEW